MDNFDLRKYLIENKLTANSKLYTKDDLVDLLYDYEIKRLGKFDPDTDEERNFTNPNSPGYISLDRIKSKIVSFLKDK